MTETKPFSLLDVFRRNAEHPDTFEIPSATELAALAVGDWIKVGAIFDQSVRVPDAPPARALWEAKVGPVYAAKIDTERFWVEVTAIERDSIAGTINNDLVYTAHHGLKCGDTLTAERRNIMVVMTKKEKSE